MLQPEEFREQTAARLLGGIERVVRLRAFVGLDGFVDEIIHVVDQRDGPERFVRLGNIRALAERLAGEGAAAREEQQAGERGVDRGSHAEMVGVGGGQGKRAQRRLRILRRLPWPASVTARRRHLRAHPPQ